MILLLKIFKVLSKDMISKIYFQILKKQKNYKKISKIKEILSSHQLNLLYFQCAKLYLMLMLDKLPSFKLSELSSQ